MRQHLIGEMLVRDKGGGSRSRQRERLELNADLTPVKGAGKEESDRKSLAALRKSQPG